MTQPLPEWPEPWSLYETCDVIEYERARADAAMARLREVERRCMSVQFSDYSTLRMFGTELLSLIGELPPPPNSTKET